MIYPHRLSVRFCTWMAGIFLISLHVLGAAIQPVAHVIQISVDGLGALYLKDYLQAAPAQFPAFCRFMTNGASTLNARCDFLSSITMPNHTSMLTGRPMLRPDGWLGTTHHGYEDDWDNGETLHNSGNLTVTYKASVLDVAHDHGLSTAFYASKTKFALFTRSYDVNNGAPDPHGQSKIDFSLLTSPELVGPPYYATEPLLDSLVGYLTNAPWNYVFLHFSEPDYNGHFMGGWGSPAYSNSVRHVDQQIMRIFRAIDSTPSLSNQVALVLTADHGGFGAGHGNYILPYEYTLPLLVWAPGLTPGSDLYRLFGNRFDPGTNRVSYSASQPPLWNGDSGNIALMLLGLPPIPGSSLLPQLLGPSDRLNLNYGESTISVSWPVAAAGYVLESATGVGSEWTPVTTNLSIRGSLNIYTNSYLADAPQQLFRLRKAN